MNTLQYGSYVFAHNPRKIELVFQNHLAAHILPGVGAKTQMVAPRCRRVRCEGEVFGNTPEHALAELSVLSGMCAGQCAPLYLPTGIQFDALVSSFGYLAQGDGRVITYTIEFIEQMSGAEVPAS